MEQWNAKPSRIGLGHNMCRIPVGYYYHALIYSILTYGKSALWQSLCLDRSLPWATVLILTRSLESALPPCFLFLPLPCMSHCIFYLLGQWTISLCKCSGLRGQGPVSFGFVSTELSLVCGTQEVLKYWLNCWHLKPRNTGMYKVL